MGVFRLIRLRMLSMMDLVRRARMNAVFLYEAANAGVVSIVAASRTAAIFLFIVILPSGHWLVGTGPNDHATTCMPLDVKED